MTRRAARPIGRSREPVGWRRLTTPARLAGLALTVISAGAIGWLVTSDQFALGVSANGGDVAISGYRYTDAADVNNALAISNLGSNNVFTLRTGDMRRALLALPEVADADVHVVLPNRLVVAITERTAVLQIDHDNVTYLIDGDGVVLEARAANAPLITDLPLIHDERIDLGIHFEVGQRIDPTESAAMLQIGALTPTLVGSSAFELTFSASDGDGFVVTAVPAGWRAVFGFYTPTLRPPSEIAQQVQCLRSLLATGETAISTIYLASSDDRCGTYQPRPSPGPT